MNSSPFQVKIEYVKRYEMIFDLQRQVLPRPVLPEGFLWIPWHFSLLETHALVKFLSFRNEIDATIFPTFRSYDACLRLMQSIASKRGFIPQTTWLIAQNPYETVSDSLLSLDAERQASAANQSSTSASSGNFGQNPSQERSIPSPASSSHLTEPSRLKTPIVPFFPSKFSLKGSMNHLTKNSTNPGEFCATIQGLRKEATAEYSRTGHFGAIQNVAVMPQYRKQGLGRALVLKSLYGFRLAGCDYVTLEVTGENQEAVHLYRSIGFQVIKTLFKETYVTDGAGDSSKGR